MTPPILSSRVLVRPADFEASRSFYETVLGLTRSREFGAPPRRGLVYFLGGAELELTETPPGEEPGPRPAGVRLWLRVPAAGAACATIHERGWPLLHEPETKPWGLIEASVLDPDGLELVIVEVPADHPLRRDPR